MARLKAPLLSLDASGSIAKALVFSKWKGVPYARVHVVPRNPRATAQLAVRGVFSTLNELWKRMPTLGREPFAAAAAGQAFTDRNKHIGVNVVPLRDDNNFSNYVWSLQGGAALPPTEFTLTSNPDQIRIATLEIPTPPLGYTFLARVAAGILDGLPATTGGIVRTLYAASRAGETGSFIIPDVPAGTYSCGAWIKWTRTADGKIFYSSFLASSVLVT